MRNKFTKANLIKNITEQHEIQAKIESLEKELSEYTGSMYPYFIINEIEINKAELRYRREWVNAYDLQRKNKTK